MAALIRALAVSGSRKSDGTANASGRVYLYSPGTTTIVSGYHDDELSEAHVTVGGGIALDAAGKVKIWVNDPVDVVVSDSSGTTVDTFLGFNKVRAEQVEVENANYIGALTDDATGEVTQELGGKIDLDTLLTRSATSLGPDFKYLESAGATARSYIEVIGEIHVTPQDFDAAGNGIRDDTSSIIAATTELTRRGGGELYFPPGTYRITSALTLGTSLVSAAGISFRGAGSDATTIRQDTAATNLFTTYATGFRLKGMTLTHDTTSTGTAVFIGSGDQVILEDVVTDGTFRKALNLDGCDNVISVGCKWIALSADAAAIGVTVGAASLGVTILGGVVQGGSTGTAFDSSQYGAADGGLLLSGIAVSNSAVGVNWNDDPLNPGTFNGKGFTVIGCSGIGALATPFNGTIPGDLVQYGNRVEGRTANVTSGGTFSPRPQLTGRVQRAVGTTTGVAYVIGSPSYVPTQRGYTFIIQCVNAAGGAVTGWDFTTATVYKTNGAVLTDLHTTSLTFEYDLDASVWREIARTDTVT